MSTASQHRPHSLRPTVSDVLRQTDAAARALAESTDISSVAALRQAWETLLWSRAEPSEGESQVQPTELAAFIRRELSSRLPPSAATYAMSMIEALVEPASTESEETDFSAASLHLQVLRRAALDPGWRTTSWLGLVLVAAILAATFGSLGWGLFGHSSGPWYGEYFGNRDLTGEPKVRHARKLEFDWGKDAPTRGIDKDNFSALWETCLLLEEETEVKFRVSSDDGSRLYANGELVVDNWGTHTVRTRTGAVILGAGTHHLRVEYFEGTQGASISVLAAFGEGQPETIPVSMLAQPGSGDAPCAD